MLWPSPSSRSARPGAVASYNNAAYVLAGRLIEKVTVQAHEAAIKRLIP